MVLGHGACMIISSRDVHAMSTIDVFKEGTEVQMPRIPSFNPRARAHAFFKTKDSKFGFPTLVVSHGQ